MKYNIATEIAEVKHFTDDTEHYSTIKYDYTECHSKEDVKKELKKALVGIIGKSRSSKYRHLVDVDIEEIYNDKLEEINKLCGDTRVITIYWHKILNTYMVMPLDYEYTTQIYS